MNLQVWSLLHCFAHPPRLCALVFIEAFDNQSVDWWIIIYMIQCMCLWSWYNVNRSYFIICLAVNTPEDVVHRYRAVLKEFRRTRSVSLSCKSLSVDRNTIALTAIIAEVLIAAEGEDFGLLPEFTEEDTIGNYAKTCKTFLEGNKPLEEKIKWKKSLSCYL